MFETATLGRRLSKKRYEEETLRLREALLAAQGGLRQHGARVVILVAGVAKSGRGEILNLLNEWMDPRWIHTAALGAPRQEARERPPAWRSWTALAPAGRLGLFDAAWYAEILDLAVDGPRPEQLEAITAFERMLTDDGVLILKLWLHLGAKEQKAQLAALAADPATAWRVTPADQAALAAHGRLCARAEEVIQRTSRPRAPWEIVECTDARWRDVEVGTRLLAAMTAHLRRLAPEAPIPQASPASGGDPPTPDPLTRTEHPTLLDAIASPRCALDKEAHARALAIAQGRLNGLQRRAHASGVATVLAFEGCDAAGKGGAIRRITRALDARQYAVYPVAAPTEEERAHHYLWRFWRHVPAAGRVAIFDRTWYGRVLVERVEGFASPEAWRRAYAEINLFERELTEHGIVLVKFYLHIGPEEQRRRFEERLATPHKRWKITDEDWRNRARWADYAAAVHDMVERTSTAQAPWHLVGAEDKRHARLEILKRVGDALEARLGPTGKGA